MNRRSFFSLCPPTGPGRAALPSAQASQAWTVYRGLNRSQWRSPAEVERLQLAKARLLLKHCVQNVPFYRRQWTAAGIAPQDVQTMADFRRLPLLPRRTYQEEFAAFHAEALPSGVIPIGKSSTSGASGVSIDVLLTNESQCWWWGLYLRDLEWCGFDPRAVLAVVRTAPGGYDSERRKQFREGISFPCWAPELQGLIESGPSHGMDLQQTPRRQLTWLRQVAPTFLLSHPSNLDLLAGVMGDAGEALPTLKGIQTFAETLTAEARARIETAFGVPVKDVYSCCEAGYLASPCPEGHGLHVHAEHVLLEVLDAQDQPCLPGQTGRVVLTTFHNQLTPLIRYDIMDDAIVGSAPCPCGRGLPLLARVQGKRRPLFRLPDGRMKTSNGVAGAFHRLGGIRQYQVVQRAVDQFLVRVVPAPDWTAEHPGRIRRVIQDHVEAPVRVEVEVRDRLELPPGGKLPDIVSELEAVPEVSELASQAASAPEGKVQSPQHPSEDLRPRQAGVGVGATPTILFGWELGGGLGHVQRLLPLIQALAAHGCRPVLACKNLVEPWPALRGASFPIVQSPLWQPRPWRGSHPFQAVSFADILAVHGYAAVEDLAPMVRAWQGLIDLVQPALIVCDHSPTLCLAAYGTTPTVVLGSGFSVPPVEAAAFPLLLPGRNLLVPEAELLAVVREVQRRRGRPAPDTLPGLFAGAERFLTVLPEMDPYQGLRRELPIGPLELLTPRAPPPARPRYFAYLSAEAPGLEPILGGLARSGLPGCVYLRGATPELRGQYQRQGLEILDKPRPLEETVPPASVVVHHAGVGLAQHALAAGRPQLTFPSHLEHILTAQLLHHRLGVGRYVVGALTEEVVARELQLVVGSQPLAEQAAMRAADLQLRGPWNSLHRIAERCLLLVEQIEATSSLPERSYQ